MTSTRDSISKRVDRPDYGIGGQ